MSGCALERGESGCDSPRPPTSRCWVEEGDLGRGQCHESSEETRLEKEVPSPAQWEGSKAGRPGWLWVEAEERVQGRAGRGARTRNESSERSLMGGTPGGSLEWLPGCR